MQARPSAHAARHVINQELRNGATQGTGGWERRPQSQLVGNVHRCCSVAVVVRLSGSDRELPRSLRRRVCSAPAQALARRAGNRWTRTATSSSTGKDSEWKNRTRKSFFFRLTSRPGGLKQLPLFVSRPMACVRRGHNRPNRSRTPRGEKTVLRCFTCTTGLPQTHWWPSAKTQCRCTCS
jgi:hypothetical protein